ncbi:MAG: isopentenyl phosphate kinase [Natronomonas sp.]
MTTVLKLGGSVITRKDTPETVDREALEQAASALAGVEDIVVVHGAGSFGHHHADAHGVSSEDGTDDPVAVREIHGAMKRLNGSVLDALGAVDVPAVPVHPLSSASRTTDGELVLHTRPVETMLEEGFVPVLHGDVVSHDERGATILSGDELVVELTRQLDADRIGVCSAVPGVLDERGDVIETIDSFEAVESVLGGSDATDVTGGMSGKVRTLLSIPVSATIFDLDGLGAFLDGETPGTTIE